jgi:pimeloyl-ACP methyl ester carboxylesterase
VWEKRLEVAPTVPRELHAEGALSSDGLGLDRLALPCLLLVGSSSPEWARRSTDAFAAAIPGAEVRTLQGHGHGAAVSAPELLAAELERFLLGGAAVTRPRD